MLLTLAALIAAAPAALPPPPATDLQCLGLMITLSRSEDPRIGSAALVASQFFLGRIEASGRTLGPAQLPDLDPSGEEKRRLLAACGERIKEADLDLRALDLPASEPIA